MQINGIDLDGLAHEAAKIELPEVVPGRVVHIDADFLAYQVSAERADGTDQKTFDDMKHNAGVAITTLKLLAGATAVHLHLTPSGSNKGGRYDLAIQREYQGNRIDKPKPRYLHIMRDWLYANYPATQWQNAEADDGMSSAQYAAIAAGKEHLSVIASKDKDLNQVPGLHLDWDAGTIHHADTFGRVVLRETGSGTKKLSGYGQSFFWAQMLTGDTADNIQGLPKVSGAVLNIYKPTASTETAQFSLGHFPENSPQWCKAKKVLADRKAGACGPVLVAALLDGIVGNREAFNFVKSRYEEYGNEFGFVHWKTGEAVDWRKVFVSEAQLLWLRRNPDDRMDVARWWKEFL